VEALRDADVHLFVRSFVRLTPETHATAGSVKEWPDLEIWVRGHSRLFKLVPFESLGTVSYSQFTVTMAVSSAVCEIFRVK